MSNDRRLPAFARPLADLRRRGHRPASQTVVVRLDRWPAKDRPAVVAWPQVVVPTDAQPAALDFWFLAGLDVVVAFWRSASPAARLRALLVEILKADPAALTVIDTERNGRAWFIKSLSRGVEVQL